MKRCPVLLALSLLSTSISLTALAQEEFRAPAGNGDGADTHLFRAAVDSKGFFTVNGSDILGANSVSFGMVLDYGQNLLRTNSGSVPVVLGEECDRGRCGDTAPFTANIPGDANRGVDGLVRDSFQGAFKFNYGLGNAVVVGLSVPVVLILGDPAYNIGPAANQTYNTLALGEQGIGNPSIHGKLRLTRLDKGIGLAIIGEVGVPVGQTRRNLGAEPGFWYWPQAVAEYRIGSSGFLKIGANVGFRGHTGNNSSFAAAQLAEGAFRYGNLATYGLGLALRASNVVDLVAEGYGSLLMDDVSADEQKLSQELVGGIKLFVERNSFLMMGAGRRAVSTGFEAADLRLFLGFVFEPSIGDRDGDGYKDDEDLCPDDPEDFDGFEDLDGCSDPDNDKDGILDVDDRCPDTPEDHDGDEDDDGCPEASDGDRDGDGLLDSRDKCPDDPEDRDGFQDQDGCPDPDNDKDGILDVNDQCPLDPEDRDGFEDEDGCPDPDNDKDQILDVDDQCPNDPEVYNGFQDEDGCPDKGKVVIEGNDILILEKIQFETDSAEIKPDSFPLIDAVYSTLSHHPEFSVVEVAGHADERSSDAYNLDLTQRRAKSVVQALTSRGLSPKRLVSQGYGEYCPLDAAHSAAAWEKNRRVEFKVVKTEDGVTPVQRGCPSARNNGVLPPHVP